MGGGDCAESYEKAKVDGDGEVEEGADDFLDEFGLGFGEQGGGIGRWGELLMAAVDGLVPFVGCVAGPERTEGGETLEGFGDVVGHGEVNVAVGSIAPVERQAQEFGACAVDCCCVQAVKGGEEVVEIGGGGVFNTEIVVDEGKLNGVGFVAP